MASITRTLRRSLLASALAIGMAANAGAAQFSNTFFFGDSLTDAGAYGSRFTTNPGNVWSQFVASYFGANGNWIGQGGSNYAMGGARVTTQDTYSPQARSVTEQVSDYLAGSAVRSDALYFISGGANDIFYQVGLVGAGAITPAQMQGNISTAATDFLAQIARLHAAGARYIVVANVPDISQTPLQAFQTTAPFGALTQLYNGTLSAGLNQLGFDVIALDLYTLLREVVANPGAYGFVNASLPVCTTESSLTCTPATLRDPNGATTWVFADGVHPSSGMHRVAGDYAVAVIEAPEKAALLAETPISTQAAQQRSVMNRMTGSDQRSGGLSVWGSYDYSAGDIDRGARTSGAESAANSVLIGADLKLGANALAGLALGFSGNELDFANNGGGFKLEETMLTGYGLINMGAAYLGGTLSYGDLNFKNVQRNIVLGAGLRTETGHTDGSHTGIELFGGYWMGSGSFKHGPFVGLAHQRITVKGYTENGANSTTMHFGEQKRESMVGRLGYQLSAEINSGATVLRPYARVGYEREFNDDDRHVRANLVTMGGSFQMPVYRPDADTGRLDLGLSAQFGKGVTAFAGFSALFRGGSERNQSLNIGVQIPL